jgi:hypothetical protein
VVQSIAIHVLLSSIVNTLFLLTTMQNITVEQFMLLTEILPLKVLLHLWKMLQMNLKEVQYFCYL